MRAIVAALALIVTGCGGEPSPYVQFEQKCEEMEGFVVQVDSAGWNDNGRYSCIVDDRKVYVPDVPAVLQ